MRKTKIVCTIGPASTDEKIITDMCKAGMNVARLNFSHGTHEEQQKKIDIIKKVRTKLNLPIAVMLDTKGPEYRIRTFKDGKIASFGTVEEVITKENLSSIYNVEFEIMQIKGKPLSIYY